VFLDQAAYWPSRGLVRALREIHGFEEFRVAFCLETSDGWMVSNLHRLTLATRAATTRGFFDFLPCPPSVFSRTVTRHDCFMTFDGDDYWYN